MLVIFDWDGTLANSVDHIVAAMFATISEMRLEPRSKETCRAQIGLGLFETARSLYPELSERDVAHFRQAYSKHYLALGQEQYELCLYDGALSTLEYLQEQGHLLAVATGKSRAGLNRVLKETGLGELFRATRAADETASKPDPLMLKQLLQETGYSAERAVMIGDTSYDLAMAREIDMPRIGVSYGVHDNATLNSFDPIGIADSAHQLPTLVQTLA